MDIAKSLVNDSLPGQIQAVEAVFRKDIDEFPSTTLTGSRAGRVYHGRTAIGCIVTRAPVILDASSIFKVDAPRPQGSFRAWVATSSVKFETGVSIDLQRRLGLNRLLAHSCNDYAHQYTCDQIPHGHLLSINLTVESQRPRRGRSSDYTERNPIPLLSTYQEQVSLLDC
jgi:hypothetical protein